MSDFCLRQLIREVLTTSEDTEPSVIWLEVRSRMGNGDFREACDQFGPEAVRQEIGRDRRRADAGHQAAEAPSHVVPEPRRKEKTVTYQDTHGGTCVSPQVAALRELSQAPYSNELRERWFGHEGWVFFGDFTVDDCRFAADLRRKQAQRNEAEAAKLDHWAQLLLKHRVSRIADLPASVLAAQFERQAA